MEFAFQQLAYSIQCVMVISTSSGTEYCSYDLSSPLTDYRKLPLHP